jgi:beta-glucosidase
MRKTRKPERPLYRDPSQPVEKRVEDILSKMTLDEKLQQMGMVDSLRCCKDERFSPAVAKTLLRRGIGSIQDPRKNPATNAALLTKIQEYLVRHTRLGIPALVAGECSHGHMSGGATIFPQSIGMASTWNTGLVHRMAAVSALEARAVGVHQALSPDLDLGRDPRWGRIEETYGEDPYLVAQMGVAYVRGLQGGGGKNIDRDHMVATVKHFAAHGNPQGGLNLAPVAVGPRELRDTYLPPFEAAFKAGALSVMPAYSEFDGIPCHSNRDLLTNILREEWGFKGYVFSDYGGVEFAASLHRTASDLADAGRQALEAGMDMEAPSLICFGDKLKTLIQQGVVSMDTIDLAVRRILRVKFVAGLFEHPYPNAKQLRQINSAPHRKLARQAAQESIVLLKNSKNLLPLNPRALSSIAVIGPNAKRAELGDYSMPEEGGVTPIQGIRAALPKGVNIIHAEGCGLMNLSTDGIAQAVDAAARSDVAILFVGGSGMTTYGIGWGKQTDEQEVTSGEGFDVTDLGLPGVQQQLVEAVVATGKPTVVVLVGGRPLSTPWIVQHVPAILAVWCPGEEGGHAIADILFGKVNPSGKLPVSIPATVGQVPLFHNHKPSAGGIYKTPGTPEKPGRDYVFLPPDPLFPFGYGFSYTTFKYSGLNVTPKRIPPDGPVTVHVNVRNTGKRAGQEVVQLYIRDVVSSTTTPIRALKGFKKIHLKPGEIKKVTFILKKDDLSLYDARLNRVVEPGAFDVRVGGLITTFSVVSP